MPFLTFESLSAATPERETLFQNLTLSIGAVCRRRSGAHRARAGRAGEGGYDGALLVVSHDPAFLTAIGIDRELSVV